MKQVIVITGASSGFGRLSANALARAGHTVYASMRDTNGRNSAQVVDVAKFARDNKVDLHAIELDVGSQASADTAIAQITAEQGRLDVVMHNAGHMSFGPAEAAFGGVDVLINNAGIMKLAKIADSDDALFDQQIAINLKGSFNAMREAAKRLRDGGRIVNFSTSVVGIKLETYGVYAATKAAIETMTAILSKEMRGRNITVNAVAPGPVGTELFLNGKSQELIDHMAKMNPLQRLGMPQDIAATVSFLAGPDGGWINGQVLRANGGMV